MLSPSVETSSSDLTAKYLKLTKKAELTLNLTRRFLFFFTVSASEKNVSNEMK